MWNDTFADNTITVTMCARFILAAIGADWAPTAVVGGPLCIGHKMIFDVRISTPTCPMARASVGSHVTTCVKLFGAATNVAPVLPAVGAASLVRNMVARVSMVVRHTGTAVRALFGGQRDDPIGSGSVSTSGAAFNFCGEMDLEA